MRTEPISRRKSLSRFFDLPLTLRAGALAAVFGPLIVITSYTLRFWRVGISGDPGDWSLFGDYVGGTLGWLLSAIALVAVYVTYLSQQEAAADQKLHSDETIGLLRQQTASLEDQVQVTRQEAFDIQLSNLFFQLVQSILACRREHKELGVLTGHTLFQQLGEQLWRDFVGAHNQGTDAPWREARDLLGADAANWSSIRGQLIL